MTDRIYTLCPIRMDVKGFSTLCSAGYCDTCKARQGTPVNDESLRPGQWPNLVCPPMFDNPSKGWRDPGIPDIRVIWRLAREVGYSVGVHGSLKADFDLIAQPWTEDAVSADDLIVHLCKGLSAEVRGGIEKKPLGRIACVIQLNGVYMKNIDLSISPILRTS